MAKRLKYDFESETREGANGATVIDFDLYFPGNTVKVRDSAVHAFPALEGHTFEMLTDTFAPSFRGNAKVRDLADGTEYIADAALWQRLRNA